MLCVAVSARVLVGKFVNGTGCVDAPGPIHYMGFAPTPESLAHRVVLVGTVPESLQLGGTVCVSSGSQGRVWSG